MTKKSQDINYISRDLFPKSYRTTMVDDMLQQLQQENKKLKEQLQQKEDIINKAKEYCNFCIKEWITDDGFVEEVLKDVLEILDDKGE